MRLLVARCWLFVAEAWRGQGKGGSGWNGCPVRVLGCWVLGCWVLAAPAWADDWGTVATISGTMGVQDGRVCVGEGTRHDIGCPTYAPYVSATSGNFGLFTSNPRNHFQLGTGIGLVWGSTDIIQFNQYWDNTDARYESLGAGYSGMVSFNTVSGTLRFGVSPNTTTAADQPTNISPWMLSLTPSNTIGMFTSFPSTTLDVRGTVRIANGGEACDANRAGAIRYVSGAFQVCYGSGGWAGLADTSGTVVVSDRIVSGTTSVVANQTGYVSITNSGVNTGYFDSVGQLVVPGVSATGLVSGSDGYFANTLKVGTIFGISHAVSTSSSYATVTTDPSSTAAFVLKESDSNDSKSALKWRGDLKELQLINYTNGALSFFTAFMERARITASGRMGIGTATPTAVLDVSGTLKIGGTVADACGPGKYGTMKIVDGRMWMCRAD